MKVYVEVTDWFKRYTGDRSCVEINVPEGTTAVKAISDAGIPEKEVGVITLSGKRIDSSYSLKDGDRLKVYPHIIGG